MITLIRMVIINLSVVETSLLPNNEVCDGLEQLW